METLIWFRTSILTWIRLFLFDKGYWWTMFWKGVRARISRDHVQIVTPPKIVASFDEFQAILWPRCISPYGTLHSGHKLAWNSPELATIFAGKSILLIDAIWWSLASFVKILLNSRKSLHSISCGSLLVSERRIHHHEFEYLNEFKSESLNHWWL